MSREPLDLLSIARVEERRLSRGVASVADEAEPVAGGLMCFAGVGSWANQAVGIGMDGPVEPAEVDRLIAFYEQRGVEPRLELCPFAHPTLVRALADRRFVVREFENVLVRGLDDLPPVSLPPGATIVCVDGDDEVLAQSFMRVRATGFGEPFSDSFERIERRLLGSSECARQLVVVDGQPAAASACEMMPPVAALFGATTLEPYRRRGLQTALIAERLRIARGHGCQFACIGSSPLIATGRNAMRLGFQVGYTKVVMVRPGEGLAASR